MRKILKFFDKLEDHIREFLSRFPVIYSLIGGIFVVVFWRAIWEIFDSIEIFNGFYGGLLSLTISTVILLASGLLVSFFVGDTIIISGIKHDKKISEKTMDEVEKENKEMIIAIHKIDHIEKDLEEIKAKLKC
ncbi:MAG: hypothetical protein UT05_C0002G0096 [Parcubacteria group bacterium GW2011_GWF2_38_76]|nr:MAG: hypothetical protein UT05_C0002G0096 [Parcubacteria group bacterium GW2011_GWF2_38_76]HBM45746.1 hypothetical protein [Patescibacteria group bacterium]